VKTRVIRWLRRLASAVLADQIAETRTDFRRLRQLHVETRLRLVQLEKTIQPPPAPAGAPAADRRRKAPRLGPRVPLVVDAAPPAPVAATQAPASTVPEIEHLDACPVCGGTDATLVCEYNKFLLLERGPDPRAREYDYSMCHVCGIVFARKRPVGPRFVDLLSRFEATLGRVADGRQLAGRLAFSSVPLDQERADTLRRAAVRGVFLSDHVEDRGDYLPALLRDRLACAQHVEVLTSLLTLKAPRILELRPRFGAIGAGVRRAFGGEVYTLPLFEGQQLLNRELYGHRADALLDYDRFTIPYEGTFDLVVANHMVTHALRPSEFLRLVRERLVPGGHLYLYNEPDDAEYLDHRESMIKVLNAFHFQAFDRDALLRALGRHGFAPAFVTRERGNIVVLAARSDEPGLFQPLAPDARDRRLARYALARDLAILGLPPPQREAFAGEWEQAAERTVKAGLAELTHDGSLRLRRTADPRPAADD
jgi:SAM-dependent methyltransferase